MTKQSRCGGIVFCVVADFCQGTYFMIKYRQKWLMLVANTLYKET